MNVLGAAQKKRAPMSHIFMYGTACVHGCRYYYIIRNTALYSSNWCLRLQDFRLLTLRKDILATFAKINGPQKHLATWSNGRILIYIWTWIAQIFDSRMPRNDNYAAITRFREKLCHSFATFNDSLIFVALPPRNIIKTGCQVQKCWTKKRRKNRGA